MHRPLPPTVTPLDFFSLFVSDDLFKLLSDQTNMYATQRREAAETQDRYWTKTTSKTCLVFTTSQKLTCTGCWISHVMGKSRYRKINQYFHMNDNSEALLKSHPNYDPLFKVRPLLDLIKSESCALQPWV